MTQTGEGIQSGGASSSSSSSTTSGTLEMGFFFDGTLNNMANAEGGRQGSYANAMSNVARLYRLYSTATRRSGERTTVRRKLYIEGIGTHSGGPDDMVDAALGTGNTGVSARVHQACTRLANDARHGRFAEIIIDVFGFSRGAAAARYFVNCVNRGFFDPVSSGFLTDEEPTVLERVALPRATVRFVGVFDTVAAIGHGRDSEDPLANADNADVNVHVKDGSAQAIYHIVAENEYRRNFALNSLRSSSGALPSGAVEFVMPGAHSDIGGGYRGRGETLLCVEPSYGYYEGRSAAEAARNDLHQRYSDFCEWMQREHFAGTATPEFYMPYDQLSAVPDSLPSMRFSYDGAAVWARGQIRPGLDKISLKLMHDQARSHRVPFTTIPNDSNYAIPTDIQHIYTILSRGEQVNTWNRALLRMNYVHWSSHYGGESGVDRQRFFRSPPRVNPLFYPNEPAPNYRRIIHSNDPSAAF